MRRQACSRRLPCLVVLHVRRKPHGHNLLRSGGWRATEKVVQGGSCMGPQDAAVLDQDKDPLKDSAVGNVPRGVHEQVDARTHAETLGRHRSCERRVRTAANLEEIKRLDQDALGPTLGGSSKSMWSPHSRCSWRHFKAPRDRRV